MFLHVFAIEECPVVSASLFFDNTGMLYFNSTLAQVPPPQGSVYLQEGDSG